MKTLCIVICHCVGWQPVINAIPCICWGILALVMFYFLLRFVVAPLIANLHEIILKSKAFEQEKFWHFQKVLPSVEKLEKKKEELEAQIADLNEKLKNEKNTREYTLEQERLQYERDYFKEMLDEVSKLLK